MNKKLEALTAIAAANPTWTPKQVNVAYEHMPTRTDYAYPEGSSERAASQAEWLVRWKAWAKAMNIPT